MPEPTPMAHPFDTAAYFESCAWLGRPVRVQAASARVSTALLRPWGEWQDARGSWPYGSLPDASLLQGLAALPERPLTWTGVIRPDDAPDRRAIEALQADWTLTARPMKPHLASLRGLPRPGHSARAAKRLDQAASRYRVEEESFTPEIAAFAAGVQHRLAGQRKIARNSSPDEMHFGHLCALDSLRCFVLRARRSAEVAGVLLLLEAGGRVLHAHSSLVLEQVRLEGGALLLWDEVLRLLDGEYDLWWGGEPAGAPGVFRFKQRFANHQAPAWIVCVELQPGLLSMIRSRFRRHAWLPDYRDPALESA